MCEKDFPLWRLRSLAYSTKTISFHHEKWEMKKEEKKEREVDTIKLFTTYSFRLQIKRYGTGESNKWLGKMKKGKGKKYKFIVE